MESELNPEVFRQGVTEQLMAAFLLEWEKEGDSTIQNIRQAGFVETPDMQTGSDTLVIDIHDDDGLCGYAFCCEPRSDDLTLFDYAVVPTEPIGQARVMPETTILHWVEEIRQELIERQSMINHQELTLLRAQYKDELEKMELVQVSPGALDQTAKVRALEIREGGNLFKITYTTSDAQIRFAVTWCIQVVQ